jgi:hypothetical protein
LPKNSGRGFPDEGAEQVLAGWRFVLAVASFRWWAANEAVQLTERASAPRGSMNPAARSAAELWRSLATTHQS